MVYCNISIQSRINASLVVHGKVGQFLLQFLLQILEAAQAVTRIRYFVIPAIIKD